MDLSHHSLHYQHDHTQDPALHPAFHGIVPVTEALYHDDSRTPLLAPHPGVDPGVGSISSTCVSKQLPDAGLLPSLPSSHAAMYHNVPAHIPPQVGQSSLPEHDPPNIYSHVFHQQLPGLSSSESVSSTPIPPSMPSELDLFPTHSAIPPPTAAQVVAALPSAHLQPFTPLPISLRSYSIQPPLLTGFQGQQSLNIGPINNPAIATATGQRDVKLASGRRVTDPSGAPNAPAQDSAVSGNPPPSKDSTGKFPCPHCHRNYLHLKHLKRHLLRHTGDRPYQCVLCKDTFSRSDILKRHFLKCSIRKGNPQGLSHLAHAHDHQKRKAKSACDSSSAEKASVTRSKADHSWDRAAAGLGSKVKSNPSIEEIVRKATGNSCGNCIGVKGDSDLSEPCLKCQASSPEEAYQTNEAVPQASEEKSPVLPSGYGPSEGTTLRRIDGNDTFNFPPPQHHPQQIPHGDLYSGQTHTGKAVSPEISQAGLGHSQVSGVSLSELDSAILSSGYNEPFVFQSSQDRQQSRQLFHHQQEANTAHNDAVPPHSLSKSTSNEAQQDDVSWGYDIGVGFFSPLATDVSFSHNVDDFLAFLPPDWPFADPLQTTCDHLLHLLFSECGSPSLSTHSDSSPSNFSGDSPQQLDDEDLKSYITPSYIRHFVKCFQINFQLHFPLVHFSTFDLKTVHHSLLLVIACVGAVYSNRITVTQVRRLMERIYNGLQFSPENSQNLVATTEELQARLLYAVLSTWHGSVKQRERNRCDFPSLVGLARRSGFLRPLTSRNCGAHGFSTLHQTDDDSGAFKEFNWTAWVEQETRVRIMFGVYLLDTAYVIYFNAAPKIGLWDLKLTLPSDDSSWDAPDAISCAESLGLNGMEACVARNKSGTRMLKQAEFSATLEDILTPGREFKHGTTNVYGKFILIHAIHVYIWKKQKQFGTGHYGNPLHSSSITPPLAISYATAGIAKSQPAKAASQTGEKTQRQQKSAEVLRFNHEISQALEKWKKCWDADLRVQYPDGVHRAGFCRDGVAFYWLAVVFIRQKKRDLVLRSVGDSQMVAQVKVMLQAVNQRPKPLPSERGGVGEIDDTYGMDDLAFDMKLLFRPLGEEDEEHIS